MMVVKLNQVVLVEAVMALIVVMVVMLLTNLAEAEAVDHKMVQLEAVKAVMEL